MGWTERVDFIIIGAGMAGASMAASLATRGSVLVLEREEHAGYHTTGRSAALFSELYGNAPVRALTRASRGFLFDPPAGFSALPLVRERAVLYFARPDQLDAMRQFRRDADIAAATELLSPQQARALVPVFKEGYLGGAVLEHGSADIDVDAMLQGFLRQARCGGRVAFSHGLQAIRRNDKGWQVDTAHGSFDARVLVNAAGAWADQVANMAGVRPLGLQPLRRTALLIDTPGELDSAAWPAAIDMDEQFYFKPDAGLLLLSPADEHPSPPCDVQPEELDVAIAVDRFEQATGASVRQVKHRWAGLRVFSPDRTPVVGFDAEADNFFWLAGQGGYGIQTAPALARTAAALACREALPLDLAMAGVDPALLSPQRFAR